MIFGPFYTHSWKHFTGWKCVIFAKVCPVWHLHLQSTWHDPI